MKSKYDWSKEIHGEMNERQTLFIIGVIIIMGIVSMLN